MAILGVGGSECRASSRQVSSVFAASLVEPKPNDLAPARPSRQGASSATTRPKPNDLAFPCASRRVLGRSRMISHSLVPVAGSSPPGCQILVGPCGVLSNPVSFLSDHFRTTVCPPPFSARRVSLFAADQFNLISNSCVLTVDVLYFPACRLRRRLVSCQSCFSRTPNGRYCLPSCRLASAGASPIGRGAIGSFAGRSFPRGVLQLSMSTSSSLDAAVVSRPTGSGRTQRQPSLRKECSAGFPELLRHAAAPPGICSQRHAAAPPGICSQRPFTQFCFVGAAFLSSTRQNLRLRAPSGAAARPLILTAAGLDNFIGLMGNPVYSRDPV